MLADLIKKDIKEQYEFCPEVADKGLKRYVNDKQPSCGYEVMADWENDLIQELKKENLLYLITDYGILDDFYKLLDETKSVTFMDIEFLRQKATEANDSTLSETFAMDDRDPFTAINLAQIRAILAKAISDLPEKEKLAVSLYYQEELTMKEIGEVLGYTESRISQMHSKAMLRLRAKLKKTLTS